jgi:hypothetical protein
MTNVTISGLPSLGAITPGSLFAIDAANTTYNATALTVQSFMLNTTGNITAGNVSASGTVLANVVTANVINIGSGGQVGSISASGNITGGNLITSGYVTAVGNVYGNYLYGNGRYVTGIPAQTLSTGNFLIQQTGNNLIFYYNGTAIAVMSGSGTFNTLNNITAYASI